MSYRNEEHKEIAETLRLSVGAEASEETAKIRLIQPFFNKVLGWPLDKIVGEYVVSKDKGEKVDYALFNQNNEPKYIIEAKSPSKNLDKFTSQLIRYMKLTGIEVGFLTNGIKYEVITKKDDEYCISDSFTVEECPSKYMYGESNVFESLAPKTYFNKVTSRVPEELSDELSTVLALQPLSIQTTPLHMGFIIDGDTIRDFYDMYRGLGINITTIKQTKKGYNVNIRKNSDVIVIYSPYEKDLPIETIMKEEINVNVDSGSGMPKNIPLLVITSPKSSRFDEYTPVSEQLPLSAFELSNLHFTKIIVSQQSNESLDKIQPIERKDRLYLKNEDISLPKLSSDVEKEIQDFYQELCEEHSRGAFPITSRENQAIKELSQLKTIMENNNKVKTETVEYIHSIIKYGLKEDTLTKDNNNIESKKTDLEKSEEITEEAKERIEDVQELIEDLEVEYDAEGVPIEEIVEQAEENGFNGTRVEEDITKLSRRGDVIQPTNKTVRTL